MRLLIALVFALSLSAPVKAEWMLDQGVAIVAPTASNSTIELLTIACGDPYAVEVYSRGGPVRPDADSNAEADYFYMPGKVQARVGGQAYALTAAGSDVAVVLFAEGSRAESYMAPISVAFIDALKTGPSLTLAFDVTADKGADGSPYETFAEFPLAGSAAAIEAALATCG